MFKISIKTRTYNILFFTFILTFVLSLTACSVSHQSAEITEQNLNIKQQASYTKAISLMKSGRVKRAIVILTKLIKQQPNHSNTHVNLGILYTSKNPEKAKQSFNTALKINPQNIYALNQLAILKRKEGNFTSAKELYDKAIEISPAYAYAHLNLGILYDLYLDDLPNALKHYEIYQKLGKDKDALVKKWIIELSRRKNKSS